MKYIVSLSVIAYAKADTKQFDYILNSDSAPAVGSICEVDFNHRKSLAIIRAVSSQTKGAELKTIDRVLELRPLPLHLLKLADWMIDYYVASCRSIWQTMLPTGLTQKLRSKSAETAPNTKVATKPTLTAEQKAALRAINQTKRPVLIHGVTGSGKTELYLQLIEDAIKLGKSAIILVPEIVMTTQIVGQLQDRFGSLLLVSHSKLTAAARKRVWLECLTADSPKIVVGPRSALFLPVPNPGVIIIDEEHEQSYKQDQSPRYQTNYVAAKLAQLCSSRLILGSATPSLGTYWLTTKGRIDLVTLHHRVSGVPLPEVTIADLRDTHELIGSPMRLGIESRLKKKQQVLLFLNRRGSASALLCEDCGKTIRCPNCETSLTFHADSARLRCHYCGYAELPPAVCPHCHRDALHFIGTGTKGVEAKIVRLYKNYAVERLDRDNADLAHIEQTYAQLKTGQIDILIGTQMIARGLDIAGIAFVGVILADSMLNIPDFSASERTFQLLTQVAGRAGRAKIRGEVLIQTYLPKNPAIVAASRHDYTLFYDHELKLREQYHYPPFCYLAKLTYAHKDHKKSEQTAQLLADELTSIPKLTVLGPVPNFVPRSSGKYLQQIILKAKSRNLLVTIAQQLKPGWTIDLDPINLI